MTYVEIRGAKTYGGTHWGYAGVLLMLSDSTIVFLNRIHAVVTGTVIIAAVWIRFTLSCIQMDTNILLMLS